MTQSQILRVFIGYDPREELAYRVAISSLRRRASIPVEIIALRMESLAAAGFLRRPMDARGGLLYDLYSNAPQSTEFAISRFLTPLLAQSGWALFVDCDVIFLEDVAKVLELANPEYAIQVVKHSHAPMTNSKMVDKVQTRYPYKNWSSVMLINADHSGNKRLSLDAINSRPGRDLHRFFWLAEQEIGDLPSEWNWLVDEEPRPDHICVAHYTNGGPWLNGWTPRASDDLWLQEAEHEHSCPD